MKNRLVYIEPNDIAKEKLRNASPNLTNVAWDAEDYNIYVDLQVVCPNRDDCGQETVGLGNNNYISLLEGIKLNSYSEVGNLTTSFTDISYSEIKNNSVSDKEALGITSIDITFDAHFYPKVNINFTDVRAYSLFMPAEESYKEELKTKAYETIDKDTGNRLYDERGRAYTNFFSSLFHFPYPCFLLTVKGFYGTKVTFRLAVDTFRSALNSSTGNFDVSISFIGYMFGLYTDIPMAYVICAPYVGELDYSLEEGSLVRSKYWNQRIADGAFKTKQGETIPTFLEFAQRYSTILNEINQDTNLGANANTYNNYITYIARLNEIENLTKELLNKEVLKESNVVMNGTFIGSREINNGNDINYTFYFFKKENEDNNKITFSLDTNRVKELHDLIKNTNASFKDLNGDYHIEQIELTEVLVENVDTIDYFVTSKIDDYLDTNNKNVPTIVLCDNTTKTYVHNEQEDALLKNIKETHSGETIYVCALRTPVFFKKINSLRESANVEVDKLRDSAVSDTEEFFARELGFTPNIENIFRMIFAHLECFCNSYMKETLGSIRSIRSTRTLGYLGVKKQDTDVQSHDDETKTFAPPFFGLYNDKREIVYPGSSNNAKLRNIHEVKLVNSYIQAAKCFGEDYNKVIERIQQISSTVPEYYSEVNDLNEIENGLSLSYDGGFTPVSPYDAFYGNRNPYSFLQNTNKIEDILYHFLLRLYSSVLLGVIGESSEGYNHYLDVELKNITAVFKDLHKENIKILRERFKSGTNDIIRHILQANNENKTKRLININGIFDNTSVPYSGDYREGMLLTRFNSSLTYGDDEKQVEIDKNISNSLYNFKGINLFERSAYDIFNKTKNDVDKKLLKKITIENNIEYGNIDNIEDNNLVHVLYYSSSEFSDNVQYYVSKQQTPNENEVSAYYLPFVLSRENKVLAKDIYSNILTNEKFKTHTNIYGKAFVILMGLVGGKIAQGKIPTYDLESNISLSKYVNILFYGSIIYALRMYANGIEIYPNLFTKEANQMTNDEEISFSDTYTLDGFVKTEFVNREASRNNKGINLTNLAIKIINIVNKNSTNLTLLNKTQLESVFNEGIIQIEEKFKQECNSGGLLHNIIQYSISESAQTFTAKKIFMRIEKEGKYYFSINNDISLFKGDSATSKSLALLLSKTNCVLNTQFVNQIVPNIQNNGNNSYTVYKNNVSFYYDKRIHELLKKLEGDSKHSEEENKNIEEITDSVADSTISEHSDLQRSLYYTMKNLYDKWICSYGNIERFLLGTPDEDYKEVSRRFENNTKTRSIKEIHNFIFVDSFYRDIGSDFICDPKTLIELITMSIEGTSFSLYQFMHELCVKNKLLMRALPVYNNFYTPEGLKEIFEPNNVFNLSHAQEDGFSSTYLIMYTHQPSMHLNTNTDKQIGYVNDSFDIGDTIVLNEFENSTDTNNKDDKKINYIVPAFGVTYSAQNQSYFKGININMDNPITTDYSIMNQLQLSQTAASGDLNHPVGIGQNIYSIYSNRSYNCTVEMMGCANIMPMMYFQLNNIPMFKGAYMIVSVKHSIKAGNMTTIFTGVRQSRVLYPFVGSSLILTSLLDRVNGPLKGGKPSSELIIGEPVQYEANATPIQLINKSVSFHLKSLLNEFKWAGHANGRKYPLIYRSNNKRIIDTIILHYTAGSTSEAKDDVINSPSFKMAEWWNEKWNTDGTYEASADFGVDDKYIVQFNPDIDRYSTFACANHANKISIEMCSTFDTTGYSSAPTKKEPNMPQWKFSDKVLENTKQLVLSLFKKYGKEIEISTHYRQTGKACPGVKGWNGDVMRDAYSTKTWENNNESEFENFKNEIHNEWVKLNGK